MRTVRTGALIGGAIAALFAAYTLNCASATTITVDVQADEDICPKLYETGMVVTSAKNVANVEDFPLNQFEKKCKPGGKIGTLVVTPHSSDKGDRNARIGIRVVAGLGDTSATACDDPEGKVGADCIIVTRTVTFVEGSDVPVRVTLNNRCVHFQCKDGYTCNPDEPDVAKRCVPPDVLDPGTSSSGGIDKDVAQPPEDSGPDPVRDAEAGALTPKQICEAKSGHNWDPAKNLCSITCGPTGEDCKLPGACPPGLDCSYVCVGKSACENVSCTGAKCEFNCTNDSDDLCKNISCDAGSCNVICRVHPNACNGVTLVGKTNTMDCQTGGPLQDQVSCDNVRCIPGQIQGTTCARTCNGVPAACGPKYECDAGDCSKFEGGLP